MKSGWVLTALDNSLIHNAIVSGYLRVKEINNIHYWVYGDDSLFFCHKDDHMISEEFVEDMRKWYEKFNMTVK
jgi:hypothetical protein